MANFCLPSPFGPPSLPTHQTLPLLRPAVPAAVASKFLPTSAFPMTASAAFLTFHRCNRQLRAWRFGVNGPCSTPCCWAHRFADFHAITFYFISLLKRTKTPHFILRQLLLTPLLPLRAFSRPPIKLEMTSFLSPPSFLLRPAAIW